MLHIQGANPCLTHSKDFIYYYNKMIQTTMPYTSYTTTQRIEPIDKKYDIWDGVYYYSYMLDTRDTLEYLKKVKKWKIIDILFSLNEWTTGYKIQYWNWKFDYDIIDKDKVIWYEKQTREHITKVIADYFFDWVVWSIISDGIIDKIKRIIRF